MKGQRTGVGVRGVLYFAALLMSYESLKLAVVGPIREQDLVIWDSRMNPRP